MTAKEKAGPAKKSDPAKMSDPAQETRELLVWGAIPSVVGGIGLIIDVFYLGSQTTAGVPDFGLAAGQGRTLVDNVQLALLNPIIWPMIIGGLTTLILLGLSRFGKKQVSTVGSIGLIVFGLVVIGYLVYTLVNPSFGSIYSLVMVLLSICLFVAGVTGLLARRVIVVK